MKKNKRDETPKDNGSILTQKTNEDFNKKKPIPNDFKKNKRDINKTNAIPSTNLKRNDNENRKTIK